jgi:hypothetical protein
MESLQCRYRTSILRLISEADGDQTAIEISPPTFFIVCLAPKFLGSCRSRTYQGRYVSLGGLCTLCLIQAPLFLYCLSCDMLFTEIILVNDSHIL